jgi:hypothetical protein
MLTFQHFVMKLLWKSVVKIILFPMLCFVRNCKWGGGAFEKLTNPLYASGTSKGDYVLCSICEAVVQEKDQHRNGDVLKI